MLKGIYKIYSHSVSPIGDSSKLIGRVLILDKNFHILEDHTGLLTNELPEGPVTDHHLQFMDKLARSAQFKVISEEDVQKGLHNDLIPDLDLGHTDPDHEYLLQEGDNEPQHVEIFDSHWILNGKSLSAEEQSKLFEEIRGGTKTLYPI